jgi:hypothetical protein
MGDYGRRLPHLPAGTELKPLEGRGITLWPFLFLSLFTHLPRVSVVGSLLTVCWAANLLNNIEYKTLHMGDSLPCLGGVG